MSYVLRKSFRALFNAPEDGKVTEERAKEILTKEYAGTGAPHPKGLDLFEDYPGKGDVLAKPPVFKNPKPAPKSKKPRENKEGFNSEASEEEKAETIKKTVKEEK